MLQFVAVCSQCVAVYCSVFAVCCSALQCVTTHCNTLEDLSTGSLLFYTHTYTNNHSDLIIAISCPLQHTAAYCSTLQRTAARCNTLQRIATHCERTSCAVQCVAVCCSALQCVAVRCSALQCAAVCCSALHCVVVCYNALQHTCRPEHERLAVLYTNTYE